MNIILLKFAKNKAKASDHMESHKKWIDKGVSDNVFHCVGSLEIGGGFILAYGEEDQALHERVAADPFVANEIVQAEIYKINVNRASSALNFLTAKNKFDLERHNLS